MLLLRLLLELGDFVEDVLSGPDLVDAEQSAGSHKSQKLIFAAVFGQMLLAQTKKRNPERYHQGRQLELTVNGAAWNARRLCRSVGLPVRDLSAMLNNANLSPCVTKVGPCNREKRTLRVDWRLNFNDKIRSRAVCRQAGGNPQPSAADIAMPLT